MMRSLDAVIDVIDSMLWQTIILLFWIVYYVRIMALSATFCYQGKTIDAVHGQGDLTQIKTLRRIMRTSIGQWACSDTNSTYRLDTTWQNRPCRLVSSQLEFGLKAYCVKLQFIRLSDLFRRICSPFLSGKLNVPEVVIYTDRICHVLLQSYLWSMLKSSSRPCSLFAHMVCALMLTIYVWVRCVNRWRFSWRTIQSMENWSSTWSTFKL